MRSKSFGIMLATCWSFMIQSADPTCPNCTDLKKRIIFLEQVLILKQQLYKELDKHNNELEERNQKLVRMLKQNHKQLSQVQKEFKRYRECIKNEEGMSSDEERIIEENERLSLKKFQQQSPYI